MSDKCICQCFIVLGTFVQCIKSTFIVNSGDISEKQFDFTNSNKKLLFIYCFGTFVKMYMFIAISYYENQFNIIIILIKVFFFFINVRMLPLVSWLTHVKYYMHLLFSKNKFNYIKLKNMFVHFQKSEMLHNVIT